MGKWCIVDCGRDKEGWGDIRCGLTPLSLDPIPTRHNTEDDSQYKQRSANRRHLGISYTAIDLIIAMLLNGSRGRRRGRGNVR